MSQKTTNQDSEVLKVVQDALELYSSELLKIVQDALKSYSSELLNNIARTDKNISQALNEADHNRFELVMPTQNKPTIKKAACRFCTIASKDYLFKVLALYDSLERHSSNFHLWICCIDYINYSILTKMHLKNATPFLVADLENAELLAVKPGRKTNEYCWTLKSYVIKYILNRYDIDSLLYCDGDVCFFSDPEPIFEEWGEYSILLTLQRDLDWVHEKYGTYQAGLIGFKKDKNGLEGLEWWRQRCIEWCYGGDPLPGSERWGDQKYLDKIPTLFRGVKIIENLGVNAAPWNSIYNNNYSIYEKDTDIFIQNDKLICFHFACMSIFNYSEFDLWTFAKIPMKDIIKNKFYIPYIEAIKKSIQRVMLYYNGSLDIFLSKNKVSDAKTYFQYITKDIDIRGINTGDINYLKFDKSDQYYNFCSLVSIKYLIKELALYNSIKKQLNNFQLWICCLDDSSYDILFKMRLENVTLIHVREVEDAELLSVKEGRSLTEYSWTLKAPLILHLIKNHNLSSVVYCDSDLYFFSNPKALFNDWEGYSVYMCKQRASYEFEKVFGRFDACLLGFRNDKYSYDILYWWRQQCIQWCFDKLEADKGLWRDQKYLDKVPNLFIGIKLSDNLGIDATLRNSILNNSYQINKIENEVFIENYKLVVYHFESMLISDENNIKLCKPRMLSLDNKMINHIYIRNMINHLYIPYTQEIRSIIVQLKSLGYENPDMFSK